MPEVVSLSFSRPKAIPQTHGAFAQFVTWMGGEFGLGPGARVAQWVSASHAPCRSTHAFSVQVAQVAHAAATSQLPPSEVWPFRTQNPA